LNQFREFNDGYLNHLLWIFKLQYEFFLSFLSRYGFSVFFLVLGILRPVEVF
jgi:hypothetical protein